MENNRHILITKISIADFLHETKFYYDQHYPSIEEKDDKERNLLRRGRKAIENHIWTCYIPISRMGKSNRELSSDEISSLLQDVKHIDDIHIQAYYKKLPHDYLERTSITIIFANYLEDDITEYLQNILYVKSILKSTAKNGSIDTVRIEKRFENLFLKKRLKDKRAKNITRYIAKKGKHPLATFLGINPRTLNSFQGDKK